MSTTIDFRRFRPTDALSTLIFINVAVFLAVWIVGLVGKMAGGNIDRLVDWLAYPSSFAVWLRRPWTIVTYMFTHYGFWHILFNMLVLYSFGRLMLYRCVGSQLSSIYLMGGAVGAILYSLAALAFPSLGGTLVGASAAVMAVVGASAAMMPDFRVELFLFGSVKLWIIAAVAFVLFAFGLSGNNPGGNVAHIGGMLTGLAFGYRMNSGRDLTRGFRRFMNWFVVGFQAVADRFRSAGRKRRLKKKPLRPVNAGAKPVDKDSVTEELDALLDKVRISGFSSLTPEERQRLFEISQLLK